MDINELQPKTEREIMIGMAGEMKEMSGAITRLAEAVEKLETHKIGEIDKRLSKVEKFMNEWSGFYKFVTLAALVLSAYAAYKNWK